MKARGFRARCSRKRPSVAELLAAMVAGRVLCLPRGADPELGLLFGASTGAVRAGHGSAPVEGPQGRTAARRCSAEGGDSTEDKRPDGRAPEQKT